MGQATISYLLDGALSVFASAQSPAISVAWENIPFTPPDALYMRPTVLLAQPRKSGLGTAPDYQRGVYQVDIYGVLNTGRGPVFTISDKLRAVFSPGAKFTQAGDWLEIESCGVISAGPEDGRYRAVINTIFYGFMLPAV